MTLDSAVAGVSGEALRQYWSATGGAHMAETYVDVSMTGGNGCKIKLVMGKYTDIDSWGFQMVGRGGWIHANLASSSRTMTVHAPPLFEGRITVDLKGRPKYSAMIEDFLWQAMDPSSQRPYGFEAASNIMNWIFDVRERFGRAPRFYYESGDQIPGMRDLVSAYRA
jgi:hypothetical protein